MIEKERLLKVLNNMIHLVEEDYNGYAGGFSDILEEGLDTLLENDYFGTEGQCDPRGDHRDGDYSMEYVEGVDT